MQSLESENDTPEIWEFQRLQHSTLIKYDIIVHPSLASPSRTMVDLIILSVNQNSAERIATSIVKGFAVSLKPDETCCIYWLDGPLFHEWAPSSRWVQLGPDKPLDPSRGEFVFIHDFCNDPGVELFNKFSNGSSVPVSSILISPCDPNLGQIKISETAPYIAVELMDNTVYSVPILYKELETLSVDWCSIGGACVDIRQSEHKPNDPCRQRDFIESKSVKHARIRYEDLLYKPSEPDCPMPAFEALLRLPPKPCPQQYLRFLRLFIIFLCIIGLVASYNGVDHLWLRPPLTDLDYSMSSYLMPDITTTYPINGNTREVIMSVEYASVQEARDRSHSLTELLWGAYELATGKLSCAKSLILQKLRIFLSPHTGNKRKNVKMASENEIPAMGPALECRA